MTNDKLSRAGWNANVLRVSRGWRLRYLNQLLQQRLQVRPDGLVAAQLQVAKSLGVETHLRGRGVLQHLPTHAHCQVVVSTHLLKTHTHTRRGPIVDRLGGVNTTSVGL